MKKWFMAGLLSTLFIVVIGVVFQQVQYIFYITSIFGVVSLFLSGLFLSAFVSGDQMRANFSTEIKKMRTERTFHAYRFALFSLPHIGVSILSYMLLF